MWLFSVFHQHHIFKHQSTSRIDRCCTAVMASRLTSQPLKTNIRNFSEEVSSLYHIPEVITVELFQKLCSFIHSTSSGWNFQPALSAFIQLRQKTVRHNAQISRLFLSNHVLSNFSVFFFFSLSRFYLIIHAFLLLKIRNYKQRSFSLSFKMPN